VSEVTQYHVSRLGALKTERSNFDAQWEEAAARASPAHVNMFTGAQGASMQQGQKKTEQQFDGTTAAAGQKFMAVMESLVTPQNSVWHMLKVLDKVLKRNRAVKRFFDDLSDQLYDYRYRAAANFVGNAQQAYHSLGIFGNGVLYIDQPDKGKGLRYKNIFLGEAYFVENHAGVVDTLYRIFRLTNAQMLERYGDRCPDVVKEAVKNPQQRDQKREVLHVVLPNNKFTPGAIFGSSAFEFLSLHIDVQTQTDLRASGYDCFPYAIARYTQISGETYGRGPAQYVLPSIKGLNEQKKTHLKQGHRHSDPTLLAYDDGKLGSAQLRAGKMVPGGVSKDGRLLIQPLPAGNMTANEKLMEMERVIIHDAFLISLFQILVDTPTMTATEVLERAREKGMLLAPTAGRLQAEWLGPMIEREIILLARQQLLPDLPPILKDAAIEYKIEYDNPMSRMARSERASGFMRALSNAAEYAKMTGDVEPLDWFDFDRATPAILDIHGSPIDWTRSKRQCSRGARGARSSSSSSRWSTRRPHSRPLRRPPPD
jgi:hypothetical protein